jgi:hypothetical protein
MATKRIVMHLWMLGGCLVLAATVWAAGDKVIPQVADGTGGGLQYKTKFDLTNLGPYESTKITKVNLLFFHQDGTPWTVPYQIGSSQTSGSSIPITLDALQTLRIETLGTSPGVTSGYAVLQSNETTGPYAEDYEVGITVYYEISQNGQTVDTVSVPVGLTTYAFMIPVQNVVSQNIYSGFAIVDLSGQQNYVTLQLYPEVPNRDSTGLALTRDSYDQPLQPNHQITGFLGREFFSSVVGDFKGMIFGLSYGPVAVLGLLQTSTPTNIQYATLVPSYRDYLRRNSFMYLQQGFPLDADLIISDYFDNTGDTDPWDLLYQTVDSTHRQLLPQEGAKFADLGTTTPTEFDALEIQYLRGLNYTTAAIDLSDSSSNLAEGHTFAIKTGLGRYARVRIALVVQVGTDRDLQLQIYTYR